MDEYKGVLFFRCLAAPFLDVLDLDDLELGI